MSNSASEPCASAPDARESHSFSDSVGSAPLRRGRLVDAVVEAEREVDARRRPHDQQLLHHRQPQQAPILRVQTGHLARRLCLLLRTGRPERAAFVAHPPSKLLRRRCSAEPRAFV
jgi:hypothetical protein